MSDTGETRADILARLDAAARRVDALEAERDTEAGRRNDLIAAARDAGASWSEVARAARRSPGTCAGIVAGD